MTPPDRESDRRAGERLQILGSLSGEVSISQPLAVNELSRTGAQIETSFPLALDSLHEIRLVLGDTSVILKGRIVHCSVAEMDREVVTYRSGLEFIEPSAAARGVIARFIDATKSGRAAR